MKGEKIVCNCLHIKRKRIDKVLQEKGYSSFNELASELHIGRICGGCRPRVEDIIQDFADKKNEVSKD